MAKSKKQVTKFKNIPLKKEQQAKKITKKKDIAIPVQNSQNVVFKKNIPEIEKKLETTVDREDVQKNYVENTSSEKNSIVVAPVTPEAGATILPSHADTFLESEFERDTSGAHHFPKISRVITERWFLIGLVSGILLAGIIIIAGNIQANIEERKNLEQKREKIKKEITYWQENARKYPGYRDAYFQLALLEYQLGDAQSAQNYINKVEAIDPNFQEVYKLEKVLKGD